MSIVRSLLEQDLYKFTMWQTFLHKASGATAEYKFVCRNRPAFPLAELAESVNEELDHLCSLRFQEDELEYLRNLRFIKSDFVDFLSIFQFQRKFIEVSVKGDDLVIIAKGPLVHVMAFEIFVLYIVNELYYRQLNPQHRWIEKYTRLDGKIELINQLNSTFTGFEENPFIFFDFGLRRRFSGEWQEYVTEKLIKDVPGNFRGTSNVYLAKKYDLTPIGTMAHEYLQAFQAFGFQLRNFQKEALEAWVHEFRGDLGYALTDTVGMDAFLMDFDLYFAKLFDGLRHDSGDPFIWGEKALAHYAKLNIDPKSKWFVFSDSLNFPKALEIYKHFAGRVKTSFGIGTNLVNDTPLDPLNIVMKMVRCNDSPVAKLSDSEGKTLCDNQTFLNYLKQVFTVQS